MSDATPPTTRERMVGAAVRLLRRDGYTATSWRRLVQEAGTPWGSAYHHFPGGKEELAEEAVRAAADAMGRRMRRAFDGHADAADAVRAWFAEAGRALREDGCRGGCPIAPVVLEAGNGSPRLTAAVRRAFDAWRGELAGLLADRGHPGDAAERLATAIMVNFEGGLLVSRAQGSGEPMDRAADSVAALLGSR